MEKTWNDKQQIQFELALDMLSSYSALLRRVSYKMMDKKLDEVEIKKIKDCAVKIKHESRYFDGFDDEKVVHVINVYSKLMKDFNRDYPSEELAAEKGIASKYLETKAFPNEGKTWNDKQQIQFGLAVDILNSYISRLRRVYHKMRDKKLDEVEINKIQDCIIKTHQESRSFNAFEDEKVAHVINVYSKLMKDFDRDYPSEEIAAEKGIASKYLETKAFPNE